MLAAVWHVSRTKALEHKARPHLHNSTDTSNNWPIVPAAGDRATSPTTAMCHAGAPHARTPQRMLCDKQATHRPPALPHAGMRSSVTHIVEQQRQPTWLHTLCSTDTVPCPSSYEVLTHTNTQMQAHTRTRHSLQQCCARPRVHEQLQHAPADGRVACGDGCGTQAGGVVTLLVTPTKTRLRPAVSAVSSNK